MKFQYIKAFNESFKLQHYRDGDNFTDKFGIDWVELEDYLLEISDRYNVTLKVGNYGREGDPNRSFGIIVKNVKFSDEVYVIDRMKTFENRVKYLDIKFLKIIRNSSGDMNFIFSKK